MKYLSLLCFAILLATTLQAQITVDANGQVGIGIATPTAQLHVDKSVNNNGYTAHFENAATPATGYKYGIYNIVTGAGGTGRYGFMHHTIEPATPSTSGITGIYATTYGSNGGVTGHYNYTSQPTSATGTGFGNYNYFNTYADITSYTEYNYMRCMDGDGNRYASYNYVSPTGTGTHYGIYSNTSGAGNYAGYFDGNVTVVGTFTNISDGRAKDQVADLRSATAIINQLQPKSYQYKKDLGLNLPQGQQYGFVAQDLEQVLPHLVSTTSHPIPVDYIETPLKPGETPKEGPAPSHDPAYLTLKSINYIGLIPILTQAIKEQQAQLETQRTLFQAQLETQRAAFQAQLDALRQELEKR